MIQTRHATRAGLAVALVGAWWALSGGTPVETSRQPAPAQPPRPAPTTRRRRHLLTCHDTQGYKGTAHGRAFNERTPAAQQGCESCHGPGEAHVDGSGDKANREPGEPVRPRSERHVHDLSQPRDQ